MWLSVDFKNREKQRRYITIKYKLKGRNCKALHLRPPDITPVILGFNYEARNVPATTSSDSAVTATELLQPLDLACETLFRSSCAIQASPTNCSDDSWRDTFFGKHEHGALWLLICGALEKHLLTNIAPTYQISGKSNSVQRGHCDLNMSIWAPSAILDLTETPKVDLKNSAAFGDPKCTDVPNVNTIGQSSAELLRIQRNFPATFVGVKFVPLILRVKEQSTSISNLGRR